MKKLYSKSSLVRTVTLGAAVATLLSSVSPVVSPVFAANLSIRGDLNKSTGGVDVFYEWGSHGSIVLAGDDDVCGVDNVVGRGGKQQQGIPDSMRISAEEQYNRFINNQKFNNGTHPYGTTTGVEIWGGDGLTGPRGTPTTGSGYMGVASTGGFSGAQAEAYGIYSFATGCGSAATGNYSTVFGAGATAKAGGAQAFGVSALASGRASVAIGVDSEASGLSTVAIGGLATALGKNSVAMGTKARAEKNYAIAIGSEAEAQASGSIAIGSRLSDRTEAANPERRVIAKAENAIAIGTHTYAETEDSVAIGANAQVTVYDGVAIGGGSLSDREKGTVGYDPFLDGPSTDDRIAWKSTTGAFSVGEVGGRGNGTLTRQITGVAAGSEDTDAVNVAQLKAMREVIAGGGGWKISVNDVNPTDVTSGNIVDFSVKNSAVGPDNLTIAKNTEANKHKIEFTLNDHLKLTQVTTGQSSMSDDGFFVNGGENSSRMTVDGFYVNGGKGPSMSVDGIDAGYTNVRNLLDATEDSEAVNFGQLKEYVKNNGGGWKLAVEKNQALDINPGNTVHFFAVEAEDTGHKNIKIANKNGKNVSFDLADDINVMTVKTGESIMDALGFRFDDDDGPSITVNGIHAGDKTIKGVAAGKEDTDAVNYKQLKDFTAGIETGWKLSVDGNNATDVKAGSTVDLVAGASGDGSKNIKIAKDNNKVTFALNDTLKLTSVTTGNSVMNGDGFKFIDGNGPEITLDGIKAGNKKITEVADGTDNTDAVNYKQLKDVRQLAENGWKLSVDGNNATDVKAGSTVDLVAGASGDGSKNIKIAKDNNKVTFALNDTLKLTSVATGNSIMNSDGFSFIDGNGPKISISGINAGDKKITKVASGTDDTDAVNYKQLRDFTAGMETGWKLSVNGENPTDVKAGSTVDLIAVKHQEDGELTNIKIVKDENNKVKFDLEEHIKVGSISVGDQTSLTANGLVIKNGGPRITFGGIHAADKTITGVADGVLEKDAVNLSQLHKIKDEIEDNSLVKWNEGEKLITIGAEKGGNEIKIANSEGENRIISGVAVGKVSSDSTEAINGHQLFNYAANISEYFGGETDVLNGIKPTFTVQGNEHHNVTDAFAAVDTSITDIYSQINNVTENSLVKWNEDEKLITIGKEKGGTKIDITGTGGERTIAGVKNGTISEVSKEAINGSQINKISGDVAKFFGGNAAFQDGIFVGPQYNLSTVSADGKVEQKMFLDVGSALTGLDANVKNVNSRLTNVSNEFNQKIEGISKDALLWDEGEQAFVALHEKDGEKTKSKLRFLMNGDVNEESTDAINGSQLFYMGDKIANYFGGGASYEDGEWSEPTFKISQREANGNIVEKKYHNVADAFSSVDNSITDIYSQINNVTENSLVKQEGGSEGLITVGKATGGTKISIANKNSEDRILSGVKDGTLSIISTEAVNGSQLFTTNQNVKAVTDDLKKVAENTSKYFGGSTDVLAGIKPTFLIQDKKYHNVTEAFAGVNISITNIDNKISDLEKNNLVQQEGGASGVITIGAKTAGTKINVAGVGGAGRTIAGVKAAEKGDEAVNKDQLDKSIEKISNDIEIASAAAVLYDKDANGGINYNSVTLGGEKTDGPVALLNVKDGRIAEESYDAINGSQINEISGDIANYFGGDASFENGAFKGPKYSLSTIVEDGQVAKTNYYNVGDALTGLDANVKSVNNRLTNVSNEFNQKIEGISKDALLWNDQEQAFVALHEKDGKKTKSKLKYLLDGEIAEGSTDAITGNQLYLMSNQLANYFGGGAKYENGQWIAPTFRIAQVNADGTVGEKTHNNVADAFGGVNSGMLNINNRIDEIKNNIDSDVLHWNKAKGAYDASHDGQPSKIINVADGRIAEDSKDAVNGGQLWKTNERVTSVEKDVKHLNNRVDNISATVTNIGETVHNIDIKVDNIDNKVNDLVDGVVLYDRDANGKKVNKVTLIGGNESEPVTIDNVADGKIGTGSKEAVNGGQLHEYTQEQMKIVLDESKHYTDQRINNIRIDAIDEAVERANNYTNMKFEALNYSIENVRKEAKQAAAIGLAVSNLRYNDTPGKLSVAFGSGLWRGQSAFALGAGYSSEDGKIRSNLSATSSGGHWGVGVGLNLTLN
ncbi:Vomp family autotransporter [Bartonella taylorii]|uniref:Vomp family autotransporter n=1 Tax=Bartonella taylorii TaxID=33046 RepID=UPI001ABA490D|nr:Vomp family autotransporter [Bartonella taylorii]